MTRILGIDPSLTSTGAALIDTTDTLHVDTWTITSKLTRDGLRSRLDRINQIVGTLTAVDLDQYDTRPLIVIEAPAYDSRTGKQHDRSGLWWAIVQAFTDQMIPVVEVTTGTLKRYATGKGTATKEAMVAAAARRLPHVDTGDQADRCDALWLAAMGARHLGHPIEPGDLPRAHVAAVDAVDWTGWGNPA